VAPLLIRQSFLGRPAPPAQKHVDGLDDEEEDSGRDRSELDRCGDEGAVPDEISLSATLKLVSSLGLEIRREFYERSWRG
jgi:hypothetical protein